MGCPPRLPDPRMRVALDVEGGMRKALRLGKDVAVPSIPPSSAPPQRSPRATTSGVLSGGCPIAGRIRAASSPPPDAPLHLPPFSRPSLQPPPGVRAGPYAAPVLARRQEGRERRTQSLGEAAVLWQRRRCTLGSQGRGAGVGAADSPQAPVCLHLIRWGGGRAAKDDDSPTGYLMSNRRVRVAPPTTSAHRGARHRRQRTACSPGAR